jgi:hypothetical protein
VTREFLLSIFSACMNALSHRSEMKGCVGFSLWALLLTNEELPISILKNALMLARNDVDRMERSHLDTAEVMNSLINSFVLLVLDRDGDVDQADLELRKAVHFLGGIDVVLPYVSRGMCQGCPKEKTCPKKPAEKETSSHLN